MKRLSMAVATVVLSLSIPATAYGVNVSSNDGSGTFGTTAWLVNGANVSGSLKSTLGNPVYQAGAVVFNRDTDDDRGRWSSDTSSTSSVTKTGSLTTSRSGWDGVHSKICRNRNNLPDPCGSWSTTIFK